MTASAGKNNEHGFLMEASMFLVGFIMVLPLRLALACAKYALGRYHLPAGKLGVFIKLFHNPIELGGLAGFAVSNIIAAILGDDKNTKAILSIITNWLMYFFSLITFYVYTSGGELGNPNIYLWTIVAHYFLNGLNVTFSNGVESDGVTFFSAGVPLSSVFVAIYHKVFLYFADRYLIQDVYYWIIFGQCIANCVLMYITATCWHANCAFKYFNGGNSTTQTEQNGNKCNGEQSDEQSPGNGKKETELPQAFGEPLTWSPFMLTVFSLAAFYCVYPGIAPFLLVDPNTAYNIEMINLIVHPMPALIVCILDATCVGPGQKWDNKNAWWNACWIIEAYALFCVYTFYTILHYPDSFFGKLIIGNSTMVGFMTVSFVTAQEGLKAVGMSAVGVQKQGRGKPCAQLPTITLAISLAILNFTNFLGDGYLQTYRKADKENWPTEGYTRYRGFKFWLNAAFKLAKKNLLNAFNVDVRGRTLM